MRVGQAEAGDHGRDAVVGERRDDRERAAAANQGGPLAKRALERVEAELDGLRVRRHESRRRRGPQLDLDVGACRGGGAEDPLDLGRDLFHLLAGREADRHVRDRLHGQDGLLEERRAGRDTVHVHGRLGKRAQVEVLGGAAVLRARTLLGELVGAGRQLRPAGQLVVRRRDEPLPQRLGQCSVVRDQRVERADQRMRRVQRGAAVHARVQVALTRTERHMEVRHPPRREVERRHVPPDHPAVEDDRRVRTALVGLEKLDDRMAAGLLLAVAAEADVHGQLAGARQLTRRREEHVELALVVDRAAPVEVLTADLRLERRRIPQLERVGRLHVEVSVAEDGRGVAAPGRTVFRGTDLADRERLAVPVDELTLAACAPDERADPLAGALDVACVRRVRADRGDADELRELVEPGLVRHYGGEPIGARLPPPERLANLVQRANQVPVMRHREASGCLRARGASSAPGSRSGGCVRASPGTRDRPRQGCTAARRSARSAARARGVPGS